MAFETEDEGEGERMRGRNRYNITCMEKLQSHKQSQKFLHLDY